MKFPTSTFKVLCGYLIGISLGLISQNLSAQAISCHSTINISLDNNCTSIVSPSDILSLSNGGQYTLKLTTASGEIISDNTLRDIHLWTSVTAEVSQNDNSCWGIIKVEDKLGPEISCNNIELNCFELGSYMPVATDVCSSEASIVITSNEFENLDCDAAHHRVVTREYQATDGYGNTSTCSQTISLIGIDMSQVIWPQDFILSANTNLVCSQLATSNGIPDVALTGTPSIRMSNGEVQSLYPFSSQDCSLSVDYRDIITENFGCKKVIMRTWLLNGWNCPQSGSGNPVQKIEIADSEPPTINCGSPFVVIPVSANQTCTGSFDISLPIVSDDCSSFFNNSDELEIDIQFPGGFSNNTTSGFTVELSGTSEITYVVYDDCGNSSTCVQQVTVNDNTQPVAICDQNSVVSLRADGTAVARTQTFDDGSFDNCDMSMTVIKRNNSNCPCNPGSLEGFDYLGEQSGRYYYLSKSGSNVNTATNFAQSLEGNVVILNETGTVSFLETELAGFVDSIYIGLSLSDNGTFVWSDHSPLLGMTNWAPGQVDTNGTPVVSGNQVILNENREWEIVSGSQQLPFILEVNDPCGFSSTVAFCCEDAGSLDPLTVELRVLDGDGNFGACIANVVVQDKIEPVVTCPVDMTFDCNANVDFTDKTAFGDCTSTDNCSVPTVSGPIIDVNNFNAQCNTGTVTRTFIISDTGTEVTCVQTLTASNSQPFDAASIVWPDDLTITGCEDGDYSPEAIEALGLFSRVSPSFTASSCSNVTSLPTKDWPLTSQVQLVAGTCSQIIRTWTIIDWCGDLVNGLPPTYEWQQVINITESEAPQILNPTCQMETFPSTNCINGTGTASFNFGIFTQDNCSSPTASVTERLFHLGAPILVASNIPSGGTFSSLTARPDGYPVGDHRFIISVRDDCGNETTCEKTVRVADGAQPVVTCNTLSIPVQIWNNVPMVVLNANTLAEVQYGCSVYTPRFSFSPDASVIERTLLCNELGTNPVPVTVYVEDDFGLNTSCTAQITVTQLELCNGSQSNSLAISDCSFPATDVLYFVCAEENLTVPFSVADVLGVCSPSDFTLRVDADFGANGQNIVTYFGSNTLDIEVSEQGTTNFTITATGCNGLQQTCTRQIETECVDMLSNVIAGSIMTESAQQVEDVELVLSGSTLAPEFSDTQGAFAFEEMPAGGSYKLSAEKDINHLNGVSTIDLIKIQRHVLGVDRITSPYKLIAADIDRSGTINGIDLIELRKLILGVYTDFPQNNSWRIVDATQDLGDNPFEASIKEDYLIPRLESDMQIDFIGVKVGDVDQSYTYFNETELSNRSSELEIAMPDVKLEAGVEQTVILSYNDFADFNGLQFDLGVDRNKGVILEMSPLAAQLAQGQVYITDERASFVWHNVDPVSLSGDLIEILILPYEDAYLSELISLNHNRVSAEAYHNSAISSLELSMDRLSGEESNEMILFNNNPNPWTDFTEITYHLPEEGPTVLSIFDVSGRLVYKEERTGQKGMNSVLLSKENLQTKGVLYYELIANSAQQTRKMILLD